MYQLVGSLIREGAHPREVLYVNLEDVALEGVDLDAIDRAHAQYAGTERTRYLLLDEIQNRPGWERWVRSRIDRKAPVRIAVTGSTSTLSHGEHAALLTGRHLTTLVKPLDFREFLEFHEIPVKVPNDTSQPVSTQTHDTMIHQLEIYVKIGGFPEPNLSSPVLARRRLQHYFDDIILRDLAQRKVRGVQRFRILAAYLAETIARPHTMSSLHRATGIARDTLYDYVDALEKNYLIHRCTRFTWSPKPQKEAHSPFKVYMADTGLRNAVTQATSEDRGRLVENLVAVSVASRGFPVQYWTDGKNEVDFVLPREGGKIDAFQVTYGEEVPRREEEALQALRRALPRRQHGRFVLLTKTQTEAEEGIQSLPLWRWLLSHKAALGGK